MMNTNLLLEKIETIYNQRLYRVGYDKEINELYDTINKVINLKDRVQNIERIMYALKNKGYLFINSTSIFYEDSLNILQDKNDIYNESAVGIYEMNGDSYFNSADIDGYGIAITLSYLHIAENSDNAPYCGSILILTKDSELIFGDGETLENKLDTIFNYYGTKDKVIESALTFSKPYWKYHVNLYNIISYVIAKLNTFEEAINVIEKHLTEWVNNGCHYVIKDYNKKYPLEVSNGNLLKLYAENNKVG